MNGAQARSELLQRVGQAGMRIDRRVQLRVADPGPAFGSQGGLTAAAVDSPAAAVGDAPELLHIQVHHLPVTACADALRGSAQLLTGRGEIPQAEYPESVQPPAYGAQMQLVALPAQVVMDASG